MQTKTASEKTIGTDAKALVIFNPGEFSNPVLSDAGYTHVIT